MPGRRCGSDVASCQVRWGNWSSECFGGGARPSQVCGASPGLDGRRPVREERTFETASVARLRFSGVSRRAFACWRARRPCGLRANFATVVRRLMGVVYPTGDDRVHRLASGWPARSRTSSAPESRPRGGGGGGDQIDHPGPVLGRIVMAHPLDDLEAGAGDGVGRRLAGARRDEAIGVAVDDERRHA